jgi:hypothetical protein
MIWGGDWGAPDIKHSSSTACMCSVAPWPGKVIRGLSKRLSFPVLTSAILRTFEPRCRFYATGLLCSLPFAILQPA